MKSESSRKSINFSGLVLENKYKLGQNNFLKALNNLNFKHKPQVKEHLVKQNKRSIQRQLAIKIIEKDLLLNQEDIKRARREIKINQKIFHPNIIQLYEIIEKEHQLFLVMEHANNGDLFDYIKSRGRLRELQACKLFHEIIRGLEYLHSIGICHRNLRPENLLLDENNVLKITDFINSNTYKPGALLKTAWGSPSYTSPELIAGKPYNPLLLDIWSCGIILYFMVCGCLPFEDRNTTELYKKIISGKFSFPRKIIISCAFQDLISQMLQIEPEKRLNLKEIKMHSWYQLVSDEDNFVIFFVFQLFKANSYNPECQELIVQQLEDFGYQSQQIKDSLANNAHNSITTTYHLLMKKQKRHSFKNAQLIEKEKDRKSISINNNNLNDSFDNYQQSQQSYEKNYNNKEDRSSSCEIQPIYQENLNSDEKQEIMRKLEEPLQYEIKNNQQQEMEILNIESEYYLEEQKNQNDNQETKEANQESIIKQNNDINEEQQEINNNNINQQQNNVDFDEEEDINQVVPQVEQNQEAEENQIILKESILEEQNQQENKTTSSNDKQQDQENKIQHQKSRSKSQKKQGSAVPFNQEKFQMMKKQLFSQQQKKSVFDVRKQYQHTNIYDQNINEKEHSLGHSCHEACKHSGKKPVEVQDIEEISKYNEKLKKKKKLQEKKKNNEQQEERKPRITRPCQRHQKTKEERELEQMEEIKKQYNEQKEKLKSKREKIKSQQQIAQTSPNSVLNDESPKEIIKEQNYKKDPLNIQNEKRKLDKMILSLQETSPSKNYKYIKHNNNDSDNIYQFHDNQENQSQIKSSTLKNSSAKSKKLGYSDIKAERDKQKINRQLNYHNESNNRANEQDIQLNSNQLESNFQGNDIKNVTCNVQLKIHDGPFNMKYISGKNPTFISKQLIQTLNNLKYSHQKVQNNLNNILSKRRKSLFSKSKRKGQNLHWK